METMKFKNLTLSTDMMTAEQIGNACVKHDGDINVGTLHLSGNMSIGNNTLTNKASDGSLLAIGKGNKVGSNYFKVISLDYQTKTMKIDTTVDITNLQNKIYSCQYTGNFDCCGKITLVNNTTKTITVDKMPHRIDKSIFTTTFSPSQLQDDTFYISSTASNFKSQSQKWIAGKALIVGNEKLFEGTKIYNSYKYAGMIKSNSFDDSTKTCTLELSATSLVGISEKSNYSFGVPDDFSEITLWIPTNPELGDNVLKVNSAAVGESNIVQQTRSFSAGNNNKSIGKFSITLGQNNVAAYGSQAIGQNVYISSQYSQALGNNIECNARQTFTWNGDSGYYTIPESRTGTFNVRPTNGISGIYVGDQKLIDILSSYVDEQFMHSIDEYLKSLTYFNSNGSVITEDLELTIDRNYGLKFHIDDSAQYIFKNSMFDGSLNLLKNEYISSMISSITSIDQLPKNVTIIRGVSSGGNKAYKLKHINLNDRITKIESYALYGASSLSTIEFPDSIKEIGQGSFAGTSLTGVIDLPSSLEKITDGSFDDCSKISMFKVKNNVLSILPAFRNNTFRTFDLTDFDGTGKYPRMLSCTKSGANKYVFEEMNSEALNNLSILVKEETYNLITADTSEGWNLYKSKLQKI